MSFVHTLVKVTLRERLYEKTGHIALYLDYYPPIRDPKTMKQTRREYLGLYLYAKPTCDTLVAYNKEIREKALAICCMRQTAIIMRNSASWITTKRRWTSCPTLKSTLTIRATNGELYISTSTNSVAANVPLAT